MAKLLEKRQAEIEAEVGCFLPTCRMPSLKNNVVGRIPFSYPFYAVIFFLLKENGGMYKFT